MYQRPVSDGKILWGYSQDCDIVCSRQHYTDGIRSSLQCLYGQRSGLLVRVLSEWDCPWAHLFKQALKFSLLIANVIICRALSSAHDLSMWCRMATNLLFGSIGFLLVHPVNPIIPQRCCLACQTDTFDKNTLITRFNACSSNSDG